VETTTPHHTAAQHSSCSSRAESAAKLTVAREMEELLCFALLCFALPSGGVRVRLLAADLPIGTIKLKWIDR